MASSGQGLHLCLSNYLGVCRLQGHCWTFAPEIVLPRDLHDSTYHWSHHLDLLPYLHPTLIYFDLTLLTRLVSSCRLMLPVRKFPPVIQSWVCPTSSLLMSDGLNEVLNFLSKNVSIVEFIWSWFEVSPTPVIRASKVFFFFGFLFTKFQKSLWAFIPFFASTALILCFELRLSLYSSILNALRIYFDSDFHLWEICEGCSMCVLSFSWLPCSAWVVYSFSGRFSLYSSLSAVLQGKLMYLQLGTDAWWTHPAPKSRCQKSSALNQNVNPRFLWKTTSS